MAYLEYKPNLALQPFIDAFWMVKPQAGKTTRILPDACQDVVIPVHDPGHCQLMGTITTYVDSHYPTSNSLVGIRFKPGALANFIPVPQHLLTSQVIELDAVYRPLADTLSQIELVNTDISLSQWITAVEPILLNQLVTHARPDPRVTVAVSSILQTKGQISVSALADQVCLSQRQLERHFMHRVGLAPKPLIELVRFRALTQLLKQHPDWSLTEMAFQMGYYDSAHLARTFKHYAGEVASGFQGRIMSGFYKAKEVNAGKFAP
ncbi:helix-turn-helix domain-containing protein [Spirosoma sp. RP8]|uniref:Helix-turn-helix domain-containing protein n=1 Tax=Spirosoma liriopis TaxID=2937440 RepID=A0ABT0HST4_9BACT|nr:DUF6597 domain-containing transcriptional factor [Spirosoma liriopis]MCK8495242.1 helix-turn-helix domain-containing protein [Spirosoma liriopis]